MRTVTAGGGVRTVTAVTTGEGADSNSSNNRGGVRTVTAGAGGGEEARKRNFCDGRKKEKKKGRKEVSDGVNHWMVASCPV